MSLARAKAELDALYAEMPSIACQQKCSSSCGPIAMSFVEWTRIKKKLGYFPKATSLTCPMLKNGLCSVYAIRPVICRIWGIAETMPCPWGCKPEPGYLTTREAYMFMARAEVIGAKDEEEREEASQLLARLEATSDDQLKVAELLHVKPRIE